MTKGGTLRYIHTMLKLLITGGTGSFGTAMLARALKDPNFGEVRVFSRDEKKQFDLMQRYTSPKIKFLIGDIRSYDSIAHAVEGVDFIFHAAALKQVPTGEFFPMELVRTNILGTENVLVAAKATGVKKVILLSTDKAVHPINVMGMSKALAERIMIAASREEKGKTTLCGTRYGNVMYTRGSVIPFFIDQMKQKKHLTLTNGNMTRFMMSLDDSIDLVLFALTSGKNGEIYVKKSPAATMRDLTQALMELFKYKKGVIEIGPRRGEKLHEMLISPEELARANDEGGYFRIIPESPKIDYTGYNFRCANMNNIPTEGYTSANTARLTVKEIKKLLLSLPEIKKEQLLLRRGHFYYK